MNWKLAFSYFVVIDVSLVNNVVILNLQKVAIFTSGDDSFAVKNFKYKTKFSKVVWLFFVFCQ